MADSKGSIILGDEETGQGHVTCGETWTRGVVIPLPPPKQLYPPKESLIEELFQPPYKYLSWDLAGGAEFTLDSSSGPHMDGP